MKDSNRSLTKLKLNMQKKLRNLFQKLLKAIQEKVQKQNVTSLSKILKRRSLPALFLKKNRYVHAADQK